MGAHVEERRGEAGRLRLGLALALTVAAIGAGTWVLGSGPDEDERVPVVAERDDPREARPPLAVAPPPTDADERASRKAERRAR